MPVFAPGWEGIGGGCTSNETLEKGFFGEVLVMLLKMFFGGCHKLNRCKLVTAISIRTRSNGWRSW